MEVLWVYRTMSKTTTDKTPYILTYRIEVVILVEVGILRYRIVVDNLEGNGRPHLDLLDDIRE